MQFPKLSRIVLTRGVFFSGISPTEIIPSCKQAWDKVPDRADDGGNDKNFFEFRCAGKKLWAVLNEVQGLTIMYPEEY